MAPALQYVFVEVSMDGREIPLRQANARIKRAPHAHASGLKYAPERTRRSVYGQLKLCDLKLEVVADRLEEAVPAGDEASASDFRSEPHPSYPLTAPAVRPPTRCFWSAKKSAMTGTETNTEAAAKRPHSMLFSPT